MKILRRKSSFRNLLTVLLAMFSFAAVLSGCSRLDSASDGLETTGLGTSGTESDSSSGGFDDYTLETKVTDVINDPVFGDYGRLIFPVDRTIPENLTLGNLDEILIWYNNVNPERTVEIANYLKHQAASGEQIFYDIYTEEEKAEDPEKKIQDSFSSAAIPEQRQPSSMRAAVLFMWLLCMTVFPMQWSYLKKGITHLH